MKIRVTDNRGIWLDGAAQFEGYEAEVDAAVGEALVAAGLAKQIHTRKGKASADADEE